MTENEARAKVVAEAITWIGTPYVGGADVKGSGTDCGMILVRCFVDTGMVEPFDPRPYPEQWHMHQTAEVYLGWIEKWTKEVSGPPDRIPKPADIIMFKFGKVFAHGSIVIEWPMVLHVVRPHRVMRESMATSTRLKNLPKRYFSLW